MSLKKKILLFLAILVLFNLILVVIFSDNGLVDLILLRKEKERSAEKNREVIRENLSLYREIDRLKHDPEFIESVARKELGVVGKDEVILKPRSSSTP
ncbi:MAG: septum formation initiator family protein [Desulfobacterales bacterium]